MLIDGDMWYGLVHPVTDPLPRSLSYAHTFSRQVECHKLYRITVNKGGNPKLEFLLTDWWHWIQVQLMKNSNPQSRLAFFRSRPLHVTSHQIIWNDRKRRAWLLPYLYLTPPLVRIYTIRVRLSHLLIISPRGQGRVRYAFASAPLSVPEFACSLRHILLRLHVIWIWICPVCLLFVPYFDRFFNQ